MVITKKISLSTKGECDIIDITPQVTQEVSKSGVTSGLVTIFVTGSITARGLISGSREQKRANPGHMAADCAGGFR